MEFLAMFAGMSAIAIILGIAGTIIGIWILIMVIRLLLYANWKVKNDYSYKNRHR